MIPVWFWVTVAPAIPLLILAVAFQPKYLRPGRHFTGVRATRPARALIARCEAEWAARPHPTGWQSPAWTVSREAVTR